MSKGGNLRRGGQLCLLSLLQLGAGALEICASPYSLPLSGLMFVPFAAAFGETDLCPFANTEVGESTEE